MMEKKQLALSSYINYVAYARYEMMQGSSLDNALSKITASLSSQEKPTVQFMLYEVVRSTALLDALISTLTSREPSLEVRASLEVAFSLLFSDRYSEFTVVDQAVIAAKKNIETRAASGFINAILRRYLREKDYPYIQELKNDPCVRFNVPSWWIERLKKEYPANWESILKIQNSRPPLTLRVNAKQTTPKAYLERLSLEGIDALLVGQDGVIIKQPIPVNQLPGFYEGTVSVQDAGSQLAAKLLPLKNGDRILDACAAPGGKTAHLLESNDCSVIALEIDPIRAKKINENLDRLNLKAEVKVADASKVEQWWDGVDFDILLVDAPCTASGIVRRHPDIPWSRRPQDIEVLAKQQAKILNALWPTLKNGGFMLYSTCSIFPQEGQNQLKQFVEKHTNAVVIPLSSENNGFLPLLPTEGEAKKELFGDLPHTHDGFFYGLLQKKN